MKYAICALLTLVALESGAQKNLHDYALKRSLYQDGLQYLFTVLDTDKKGVRHHDISKTYFWLKAQRVVATQGASSGDLLHGDFEAFYPNKQLARKGTFNKGLKDGEWYYWRNDGTLAKVERWQRGKQTGKQVLYDANGVEKEVTHLKMGRSVRSTQDSTVIRKIGHRKVIELRDSSGTVVEVQRFKNSQLHGIQATYADGKRTSKTRYKNGDLVEEKAKETSEETNGFVAKIKAWFQTRKAKKAAKKQTSEDPKTKEKSEEKKEKRKKQSEKE